jgi:HKD family nuclease
VQKELLPQLLINDSKKEIKVLSSLLTELNSCDEFWFSVAFVTTSGVAALRNTLDELNNKNIKGKVLVSQYQNFTQPEALRQLLQLKNIQLKIVTEGSFHAKGYLFRKGAQYNLIVGSSNFTASALTINKEWNLKLSSTDNGALIKETITEFTKEFDQAVLVNKEFIEVYDIIYQTQKRVWKQQQSVLETLQSIKPNEMQVEALKNLKAIRKEGKTRALLISATGTGKTYLSAFDVKAFNPGKFLFIVHRANIAETAMKSFRKVMGTTRSMGLYSGQKREAEADFVFSTIQTISQDNHLTQFAPDCFDYIVIDETHRAGAPSYQKIVSYFEPKFLLGMTATPERTDGLDIFKQFHYNIAYEIRLHKALEEEMLCPFHYYGITDISVGGKQIEEDTAFNLLTAEERVDRIIEKAEHYGCDDGQVRGLVFCSTIEESKALSNAFNERGYKTLALSGSNTEAERTAAINL